MCSADAPSNSKRTSASNLNSETEAAPQGGFARYHGSNLLFRAALVLVLTAALLSAQAPRSFQQIVAQADAAADQNQLDRAAKLYYEALQLRSEWKEGWWKLGTTLYDGNKFEEAKSAFEKLLAIEPENGTGHLFLGLCQYELNEDAPALANITKARELGILADPALRKVMLYHEAMLELRRSAFETALGTLKQLDQQGADTAEAQLAWGMALLRMKPQELSAEGTRERQIVAQLGHAQQLTARKDFDSARHEFETVVASAPDMPNIHYGFGHFLLEVHDPEAAIAQFQLELKRDPQDVFARLQIAAAHYRTDSAAGVPFAQEAVRLDPALPFGHYLLGLLLLDSGDAAKAVPELEAARRAFANEPKLYFALGNAYAKLGRAQDAAAARKEFVRLQNSEAPPESAVYGDAQRPSPH